MADQNDYVITVLSRDRVGIVAGAAEAVYRLGGNIDAISQTVMRGYFTIIITATFSGEIGMDEVRREIEKSGEPDELAVSVQRWECAVECEPVVEDTDIFALSIMGKDRKGLIAKISSFLASRNINIVDMYAYSSEGEIVFISQVMVPRQMDIGQLKIDLQNMWKRSDMAVHFQHENIFLAIERVDFPAGAR
jgi:glycine cleavage system transcriptional repressor